MPSALRLRGDLVSVSGSLAVPRNCARSRRFSRSALAADRPRSLRLVKATSLILLGDPMGQARWWILLLVAFDAIYWSPCGLLFGRMVEE